MAGDVEQFRARVPGTTHAGEPFSTTAADSLGYNQKSLFEIKFGINILKMLLFLTLRDHQKLSLILKKAKEILCFKVTFMESLRLIENPEKIAENIYQNYI